jgi:hypothetical protein
LNALKVWSGEYQATDVCARHTLPLPPLGLSPEEAAGRFDLLQQKLVPLWGSIRAFNQDEQTIVVLPSITAEVGVKGAVMQTYEERFLFLLLLLRRPRR